MPERMVAVLFVTGFMSAGLTAPLVGVWADQQYVPFSCDEGQVLSTSSVVAKSCASHSASPIPLHAYVSTCHTSLFYSWGVLQLVFPPPSSIPPSSRGWYPPPTP